MIVNGVPLIVSARPTTSRARPNRRSQYASLITATGAAPGARSSSGVKVLPIAAPTCMVETK